MKRTDACIINVGFFRTGSATLAKAVELAGFRTHCCSPIHETSGNKKEIEKTLRQLIFNPEQAVSSWWSDRNGKNELEHLVLEHDFVYGGYVPWLAMLPDGEFEAFCGRMRAKGTSIHLIATRRHLMTFLPSALHQCVLLNLEANAGLSYTERSLLTENFTTQALTHAKALEKLSVEYFALEEIDQWAEKLHQLFGNNRDGKAVTSRLALTWDHAFALAGHQNASPRLPIEGIMLTLHISWDLPSIAQKVDQLLLRLKHDMLCQAIVILALSQEETDSVRADRLIELIRQRVPVYKIVSGDLSILTPSQIVKLWQAMAAVAFDNGADWITLLNVQDYIDCSFHYRAFYRSFLDISEQLTCPFGFGCAWWNKGAMSECMACPVVGRVHYEIFCGLTPPNRCYFRDKTELGLYLKQMYLKFAAAPLVQDARLRVSIDSQEYTLQHRCEPVTAEGWRGWVSEDAKVVKEYLAQYSEYECLLLDVVVPTYRLDLAYLVRLARIHVPEGLQTTFIFVVDNPLKLREMIKTEDCNFAALELERHLSSMSENKICVLCNPVNSGAPAARNRGLDESAAEYILLLDDDVIPSDNLLFEYEQALRTSNISTVGWVGLVRFPRRVDLPIIHAAIITCPLTSMFEIASNSLFEYPAWGITANILVRRSTVRFDLAYTAGEDVDFCLRLAKETCGQFISVSRAKVTHDFWPGGFWAILWHFFKWALGDGILFTRFPQNVFPSWPNFVEFVALFLTLWIPLVIGNFVRPVSLLMELVGLFIVDVGVEIGYQWDLEQRRALIEHLFPWWYYVLAQVVSNFYVIGFECGRLAGNWTRLDLLRNACRRYEWQCGRMPNHRVGVVRREGFKFAGFVLVSATNMYMFSLR